MWHETVTWAYHDMDAARRLWPRVKTLIEKQIEEGDLDLSLAEQRRLITAVVDDLLEQEKRASIVALEQVERQVTACMDAEDYMHAKLKQRAQEMDRWPGCVCCACVVSSEARA